MGTLDRFVADVLFRCKRHTHYGDRKGVDTKWIRGGSSDSVRMDTYCASKKDVFRCGHEIYSMKHVRSKHRDYVELLCAMAHNIMR